MPASFTSPADEYGIAREGAGVSDLSHRGKLRISGPDTLKFIQGMISNDVVGLLEGRSVYATLLTVKGRMITDMTVYKDTEGLLIDLEPGMAEQIGSYLSKYRLSYKAVIEDLTESLALLAINGPDAAELLTASLGIEAPGPGEFKGQDWGGSELIIAGVDRTGTGGVDVYVPADTAPALWDALLGATTGFPTGPVGLDALEMLRVAAVIPRYGVDMTEATIPLEAGLDKAINYEKGCYVGQEVVARIHWRGHVNWCLVGFVIEGDGMPVAGDELQRDGKKVGYITSSAAPPGSGRVISMGYIRRELSETGTEVSLLTHGKTATARVEGKPFSRIV